MIDDAESSRIIIQFAKEYMLRPPYEDYVNGCGLTTRLVVEWERRNRSQPIEEVKADLLRKSIDPDETWIVVMLRGSLPSTISLPSEYHGIKIFVHPKHGRNIPAAD
jgi:hypothetical protein